MITDLKYFWKKKTLLSFIAVLFVVIIHNSATHQYELTSDFFTNLTLGFHNLFAYSLGLIAVPLFFFLSGFAIFRNYTLKTYPQKIKTRIKTLLIPYLIWNIISLLFIILCTYTPLSNLVSGREMFTPSVSNILEGIFFYKYNFQFWFLYDLIIYTLITPLIYLLISNKYLGILSGIIVFFLPTLFSSFPHLNLNFTIFYFFGCFFGKHYLANFSQPTTKKLSLYSGFIFFVLLIVTFLSFYNLSLPTYLSRLILIGLLFSLWFFSDLFIPKIKPKKFIGEFFPIYTLHTYFLATIIKIIFLIAPKTSFMLFINEISSSLLTIIIVTTLAYFWHQKSLKSYNFMFGQKPKT